MFEAHSRSEEVCTAVLRDLQQSTRAPPSIGGFFDLGDETSTSSRVSFSNLSIPSVCIKTSRRALKSPKASLVLCSSMTSTACLLLTTRSARSFVVR